jgi:hypothetical protein
MLHRLLCRLYFHLWSEWVDQYGDDPGYGGVVFPYRAERRCRCCGAMERHLAKYHGD